MKGGEKMKKILLFVLVSTIFLLSVSFVLASSHVQSQRISFRAHDGNLVSFFDYNMDDVERHNTAFSGWVERERDGKSPYGRASFNSKGIDCDGRKVYMLEFDGKLSELDVDEGRAVFKGNVVVRDFKYGNKKPNRSHAKLEVIHNESENTVDVALYIDGEWVGEIDDIPVR